MKTYSYAIKCKKTGLYVRPFTYNRPLNTPNLSSTPILLSLATTKQIIGDLIYKKVKNKEDFEIETYETTISKVQRYKYKTLLDQVSKDMLVRMISGVI